MPQLSINVKQRPNVYRRYFCGTLNRPSDSRTVQFTLKYKITGSDSWQWINAESGCTDGALYFQTAGRSEDLRNYFYNFNSSFDVKPIKSEVPGVTLWSLDALASPAKEGGKSECTSIALGKPSSSSKWFALVRIWTPWLAPRHGKERFEIKEEAVLCSFLRDDGLHLVLLALSGIQDVLTLFKHNDNGDVIVNAYNDSLKQGKVQIVAAVGDTFEKANAACIYHARNAVKEGISVHPELEKQLESVPNEDEKAEWMENWYDGLTYCTWNGLGQDLTEEKIFNALDTLKKNDIKITNLIIDDNWQDLDSKGQSQFKRGWIGFDANKEGFPRGLRSTVIDIRDKHPNIAHIAVWHALLGYWGGISPTGAIAKKYKTKLVQLKGIAQGSMTVVDADDAQRLYNDFYAFLLDAQIDSVKTDAQFFLDLMADAEDRRRFTKPYQDAWTVSSLRYFATKAISCMSQIPQIVFHSQLPTNKPRLMVRNSDDFFPEIPKSHPWHIFTNAYTSLLTSHLNVLPDLDMFQTSHPYSSFHGAARCVSGGPVYITDEPGQHDVKLIAQMTAQTPRGKTIILRPSTVAKALDVNTPYEEERLLKFGTYHGKAGTGSGIIGVFNVSERPLSEFVPLSAFPGVENAVAGDQFIVRAHTTGEISEPMATSGTLPFVSLALETKGWETLTSYPLHHFCFKDNAVSTQIAVLGLLGKMTGAAVVLSQEITTQEPTGRLRLSVGLKALGVLGIWVSTLEDVDVEGQVMVTIYRKAVPRHTVAAKGKVLEIDVAAAWKEMGRESGGGKEGEGEGGLGERKEGL